MNEKWSQWRFPSKAWWKHFQNCNTISLLISIWSSTLLCKVCVLYYFIISFLFVFSYSTRINPNGCWNYSRPGQFWPAGYWSWRRRSPGFTGIHYQSDVSASYCWNGSYQANVQHQPGTQHQPGAHHQSCHKILIFNVNSLISESTPSCESGVVYCGPS